MGTLDISENKCWQYPTSGESRIITAIFCIHIQTCYNSLCCHWLYTNI